MRALIIVFTSIVCFAQMGWADGGAIQFQGDAGSFHVTVFTLPPILSAGSVDVTVLIQDRSKLDPLLDARVTPDLTAQAGSDNGKAFLRKPAWGPPALPPHRP